jgi:hypothetical protein
MLIFESILLIVLFLVAAIAGLPIILGLLALGAALVFTVVLVVITSIFIVADAVYQLLSWPFRKLRSR